MKSHIVSFCDNCNVGCYTIEKVFSSYKKAVIYVDKQIEKIEKETGVLYSDNNISFEINSQKVL